MNNHRVLSLVLSVLISFTIQAQTQSWKWTTYDNTTSNYTLGAAYTLATDASGNIYVGAYRSIVKFNQISTWTSYNSTNSNWPSEDAVDLAVDASNNIWATTSHYGVYSFNGSTWTAYNKSNTSNGLLTDWTYCITFDNSNNAYIGINAANTQNAGLVKWNKGSSWTASVFTDGYNYKNVEVVAKDKQGNIWCGTSIGVFKFDPVNGTMSAAYTKENTSGGLCGNYVRTIGVDPSGNVWFGCMDKDPATGYWIGGGLSKFNGSSWTSYKPTTNGLTTGYISAIAFRGTEVWVGTGFCGQVSDNKGLFRFDGTNWTSYAMNPNTYPGNCVYDLVVDKNSNLWIAGPNILTKLDFNPTSVEEKETLPESMTLYQNYPNPFNPSTVIKYDLPAESKVVLKIFDLLGREIEKLVDQNQIAGKYSFEFDASKLSSGIYYYKLQAGNSIAVKKMMVIK